MLRLRKTLIAETWATLDGKRVALNEKRVILNIIYEAKVISNQPNFKQKIYVGTVETDFKQIYQSRKILQLRIIWKRHWAIQSILDNKMQPFYTKCHLENNKEMRPFQNN